MPLYVFRCAQGHTAESVRPIGTESIDCHACPDSMRRVEVNHVHVIGPTVNTMGKETLAYEYMAERDHLFDRAENDTGEQLPRPNDWAAPKAMAREMLRRGELPENALKGDETMVLQGGK